MITQGGKTDCREASAKQVADLKIYYPSDETAFAALGSERAAFVEWMTDLEAAHVTAGQPYGTQTLAETTGLSCWIDFFSGGFTPAEALTEDMSNAC